MTKSFITEHSSNALPVNGLLCIQSPFPLVGLFLLMASLAKTFRWVQELEICFSSEWDPRVSIQGVGNLV